MTLILNGTDNSATTPAVTGTDTDTGVYYPAANQVALATNGTLALLVNATQNTEITASGAAGIVMKPDPASPNNSARLFFTNASSGVSLRGSDATAGGQLTFSTTAIPDTTTGNAKIIFNQYGIGVGAATPSSGAGITFNGTQLSSTDPNTLDDYEEGTFTIVIRGSSTTGTYTISSQTGTYTKIGRVVSVTMSVNGFSAASGGAGYMQITGLPFTNTTSVSGPIQGNNLDFSSGTLFGTLDFITNTGTTFMYIREVKDATGGADFAIGGISTSTTALIMSCVYQTST